jgi:hypothetical protein
MKIFNLLIILLLSGCGTFRALIIDEEFKPYYQEFQEVYGLYPQISITMMPEEYFKDPDNPKRLVVGHCHLEKKLIHISREYWDRASEVNRWELVFHELGHCFFRFRAHYDDLFSDNCPKSIMHSKIMITDRCFDKHFEHYYKELPREKPKNSVQKVHKCIHSH